MVLPPYTTRPVAVKSGGGASPEQAPYMVSLRCVAFPCAITYHVR